MRIRQVDLADAASVATIYNHYIINSHATFEVEPIDEFEMRTRIDDFLSRNFPFFVCEDEDQMIGYAYGRQFRPRPAYKHAIETSVYTMNGHGGRGVGTILYDELIAEIRRRDFHTAIGGISLPNEASVRLHEKFGFQKVAHFREVGLKFGRWIDVGNWQLLLDKA